jgi:diguanylate cyclase (GGDEF)-like protein
MDHFEQRFLHFDTALNTLPKKVIFVLTVLVVLLFGSSDLLTGRSLFFGVFYFIPIAGAAWYIGRNAGIIIAILSVVMLSVNYLNANPSDWSPLFLGWSIAGRLAAYLLIIYALSALRTANEHERELARADSLTGVANSRALYEFANNEIARARRYHYPLSVIYMDVDNFKEVNDRHGHAMGDYILKVVAETMRRSVRTVDMVARVGGDEFVIILPQSDFRESDNAIKRLREELLELMRSIHFSTTFSIGTVTYKDPPETVDELLRSADEQMYKAKKRRQEQHNA